MSTKLTISLDQAVIEQAKLYASKKGTSLSALVEQYFRTLTRPSSRKKKLLSSELAGCLHKLGKMDDDALRNLYLKEKHGV